MSKESEYPEDIIEGAYYEDDGLLSSAIHKAKAFSDEIVNLHPKFHPDIPQHELDRMRTIIESYSFVGFRRGYLEGYNDAKQQKDEKL